jgi:hypothetical protein
LGASADSDFFPSARSTKRFQDFWKPLGEEMQWLLRIVCIGYVVFLTLLLLTADPSRLIGVEGDLPWVLRELLPSAHAISFLVLAVLALTPRWAVPRWGIVLILAIYGGLTEILQGFLPPRTPEWMDWFQDLAGIAAGIAVCWALATLFHMYAEARRRRALLTPPVCGDPLCDDWENLQKVVLDPMTGDES